MAGILSLVGLTVALSLCGYVALPVVLQFLKLHRLTALNYAHQDIPTGLGGFIWLLHIAALVLLETIGAITGGMGELRVAYTPYYAAISIVFVAGWLDDTIGDRTVKGWRGHWSRWKADRTWTTGLLKAAATGCAAIVAVVAVTGEQAPVWLIGIQVLLLMLMTNAFNLLDLRPGRCVKTFILLGTIIIAFRPAQVSILHLLPSLVAVLILLPGDLRARHMLGDAGANLLGFAAGIGLIQSVPVWLQAVAVLLLLGMHKYAEKRSISAWIDSHRLLSWLDRWGRV